MEMRTKMNTPTEIATAFGIPEENVANAKDYAPTYNLSNLKIGESVQFEIQDDLPREATTQEGKKIPVLTAIEMSQRAKVTLWLSAISLRTRFANLAALKGGLKGIKVSVTVALKDHPKWGEIRQYNINQICLPEQ
jgi:hypothetical protein